MRRSRAPQQGSVVINGSIPGLVIGPSAELVLTFERGRLVRLEPADGPTARWLHETQIAKARAVGDLEWSNLAEIGVGLNPTVTCLTGNMLFDEKAAGTAHIALGTNTLWAGWSMPAFTATWSPGLPPSASTASWSLTGGVCDTRRLTGTTTTAQVSLQDSPLREATRVARSGVQAITAPDGRLQRMLRPEPGRVSACFVGDSQTAQLANALYRLIPDEDNDLPVEELIRQANMDAALVRRVLHVLRSYDLIKVS